MAFRKKKIIFKKKKCKFCENKETVIDYKNVEVLKKMVAESGKILSRRFSGNCAKHQRAVAREIKKARQVALLPYKRI